MKWIKNWQRKGEKNIEKKSERKIEIGTIGTEKSSDQEIFCTCKICKILNV